MRYGRVATALLAGGLWLAAAPDAPGGAGAAETGDGSGADIDIVVREIRVYPMRATVGDAIRMDMLIENRGEGRATAQAEFVADGRTVGRVLYAFGEGVGETVTRKTVYWNTKKAAPGAFRVRGEVFVWGDTSPGDNHLDLPEPLFLAPPGTPPPGGRGGTLTISDPRWKGASP